MARRSEAMSSEAASLASALRPVAAGPAPRTLLTQLICRNMPLPRAAWLLCAGIGVRYIASSGVSCLPRAAWLLCVGIGFRYIVSFGGRGGNRHISGGHKGHRNNRRPHRGNDYQPPPRERRERKSKPELWAAAERNDEAKVQELLSLGRDTYGKHHVKV